MATSGSYNYNLNVTQMVNDILDQAGISGLGRTASSEDFNKVVRILNSMLKAWSAQGLHLWKKEEGVVYLDQYTAKYSLGNASSDAKCTLLSDEIITQLDGALAASATSVTVTSTTGMAVADNIGIVLSSGDIHWTTIATIPTSTTLTLTSGVATAAEDEAIVFTFTNRLYKPLRILSARLVSGIDSGSSSTKNERILAIDSYETYHNMSTKTQNGTPSLVMYNPRIITGNLYVWPRPNDASYRIEFTYERYIEDLDSITDDFDFPSEWYEPLLYQGAWRTALRYNKFNKAKMLEKLAAESLNYLLDWDNEITSLTITPDISDYR